jgi:triosephosphate isomerase (TIM)
MARKLYIAGNWKMNTSLAEGQALASALADQVGAASDVDVAVAPPFVYIQSISDTLAGSAIGVGSQNMYFEDNGAFTGEISSAMLKDVGCTFAILGHSERRHVMGETDELINQKVVKALADGLDVILAVGELLEEREADKTMDVVSRQIKVGLTGVSAADMARVTVAYEPVWAIGTGVVATPEQAQDVHAQIRALLADLYDGDVAEATRIQYGGSVKPDNAAELLALPDVDGALVGGAALKVEAFVGIITAGQGITA